MNHITLSGNLTRDPEIQTTSSGKSLCRFSLAVKRRMANANGEYESDFFNIVTWNKTAENCNKYLNKGSKALVEGTVQTRSYDAKDGTKKYVTEVIAETVEFISSGTNKNTNTQSQTETPELEEISDSDLLF